MTRRPLLIVMVKVPKAGRVKTRLGRQIGMVAAAWWFRHQCRALLRQVVDPRWQVALAVSPDAEGMASRVWPAHITRLPQGGGDLGARMGRLLQRAGPGGPVMIVGADIPGLRRHHIAAAFRKLGAADAVIGPATDGGYWLIGLRHGPPPGLFAGVRWSSAHARADTLATMQGLRVAEAATLADVDEAADLPGRAGRR